MRHGRASTCIVSIGPFLNRQRPPPSAQRATRSHQRATPVSLSVQTSVWTHVVTDVAHRLIVGWRPAALECVCAFQDEWVPLTASFANFHPKPKPKPSWHAPAECTDHQTLADPATPSPSCSPIYSLACERSATASLLVAQCELQRDRPRVGVLDVHSQRC